jgi:hypothetical protein
LDLHDIAVVLACTYSKLFGIPSFHTVHLPAIPCSQLAHWEESHCWLLLHTSGNNPEVLQNHKVLAPAKRTFAPEALPLKARKCYQQTLQFESKEWVAWFLSCCCCCCCCCCSPQISSSNLAETATHNAQSVKTESNTVKMKEEVKPSSNEWVTFIVFIRLFLHLRSLLQAREIRNPQSATPKWSSKIGNGN